ncbi:MAG: UDP-N-acetylmuramoyl-L-alanyl-D-glutamate--2,6-diaminopimelate ligase, partial [Bdellovibrionales bacterium]|nr:UDP-N-acetylmuramoyl-L-alanyl-D-glutamate--2,6-diaminopimelate ligase [Bdellovibrionales bacterium]
FNGSNLIATFAALVAYGFSPSQVASCLGALPVVPGRLERVPTRYGAVFVDYAHAPDALRSVLKTVRPLVQNRLWVVFGCGGDRDPRRRSGMGQAANDEADCIVLTSDNPRSEDPDAIVADIYQHCPKALHRDSRRREAIGYTLSQMEEGDVVIVAGRGHESFQEIKGEMIPFSDIAVVRELVAKQGLAPQDQVGV